MFRKLYLEATTGCNLQCRTCIRNIWGDPSALMKWDTFEALMNSLDGLPELKRVVFTGFWRAAFHPGSWR